MPQWVKVAWAVTFLAGTGALGGTWAVNMLVRFYSDRPAPSGRDADQPPKQPAAQQPANPDLNQRGTEQFPFVVKTVPTPKSEEEAAKDKAERDDKSAADWWMVRLTAALGCIGVIQAAVFGLQARRLRQTVEAMKDIDERQSASVALSIAEATRLASANEEANRLSRESLVASRRAWLSIEKVVLKPKTTIDDAAGNFFMEVTVKNHGQTPAKSVVICIRCSPGGGHVRMWNIHKYECKGDARSRSLLSGDTIFPQGTITRKFMWHHKAGDGEGFKASLTSGDRFIALFPIAISYVVVGEDSRRVTYQTYDIMPPTTAKLDEGDEWELSPAITDIAEID